jgi:hypothetical protein
MEMKEYGKHGKPRNRLSTLPTLFGNPCGITHIPTTSTAGIFQGARPRETESKAFGFQGGCNGCPWSKV